MKYHILRVSVLFFLLLCQTSVLKSEKSVPIVNIEKTDLRLNNKYNITKHTDIERTRDILEAIILALLVFIIIFLLFIFLSRTRDIHLQKLIQKMRLRYQEYLAEFVAERHIDEKLEFVGNTKESALSLTSKDISKTLNRSILLNELLTLHAQVAGLPATKLKELYLTLGLKNDSLKNLSRRNWKKKVRGLKALAQLGIQGSEEEIKPLINHKTLMVHSEALVAYCKLIAEPSAYLQSYEKPLSKWEQYKLERVFIDKKITAEQLSQLINSENESVIQFGIHLCAATNKVELTPQLLDIYQSSPTKIQTSILRALAKIGDEESVEAILAQYYKSSKAIKLEIMHTLHDLLDKKSQPLMLEEINSEDSDLGLIAAKALAKLNNNDFAKANSFILDANEKINMLMNHAFDKRLQ